jgi:hypothetical protein
MRILWTPEETQLLQEHIDSGKALSEEDIELFMSLMPHRTYSSILTKHNKMKNQPQQTQTSAIRTDSNGQIGGY